MPKIDLLPCPFCGKPDTAKIMTVAECECMDDPTEWDKTHYGVVCCKSIEGGCGASTGWDHESPEETAKAWNTHASGWIPCSERLPEKSTPVLISVQCHRVTAFYDAVKGVFMLTETEGLFYSMSAVTHWMPLPEPPEAEDKA